MSDGKGLPNTGDVLSSVPDSKLPAIHRFIQTIRNPAARLALLEALRPRMRAAGLHRTYTPLRLFCLPFECLLSERMPKAWQIGRVPRAVIGPTWTMILAESKDPELLRREDPGRVLPPLLDPEWARHPLFDATLEALAVLRRRAVENEAFRAKGLRICPGYWDILGVIDDALRMRADVIEARARLAALPSGRLEASWSESVLAVVRRAAGSRQRLVLMMLILAKSDGMAARILELSRLLDGSAGSAVFSEIARTLVEDLHEDLERSDKAAEGQSLEALLEAFKGLGGRISAIKEVAPERRDIQELSALYKTRLRTRFAQSLDSIVTETELSAETGSPLPPNLTRVLGGLAASRALMAHAGSGGLHRRKTTELMAALEGAFRRATQTSADQPHPVKAKALGTVMQSAHALEPLLGADGTLALLRANFAQLSEEKPAEDKEDLLVQLVEFMLSGEAAPPPA